jgi:uncharacterized protein (DUF1800 family)
MALFFHQVFATALSKVYNGSAMSAQIQMFRQFGLSDLRTILIELSRDPAMIFWLDNNENHKDAPNENYGRELLELFTMGVGNYTEQDVKMATRAFTGWPFYSPIPRTRLATPLRRSSTEKKTMTTASRHSLGRRAASTVRILSTSS